MPSVVKTLPVQTIVAGGVPQKLNFGGKYPQACSIAIRSLATNTADAFVGDANVTSNGETGYIIGVKETLTLNGDAARGGGSKLLGLDSLYICSSLANQKFAITYMESL